MADVEMIAEALVICLAGYFGIGAVVAVLFLAFGVSRIDAAAKGASPFFPANHLSRLRRPLAYIILRFLSLKKINLPAEDTK